MPLPKRGGQGKEARGVYSSEYLSTYPYFQNVLESVPLSAVHDSLTGLISRKYMLEFIRDLIERLVPFTLGIIDLDNFKSINDHYGHATGDGVLAQLGQTLRDCVGQDGLAGRFGGDELLLVYFKSNDYNHIHDYYASLIAGARLLRRSYTVNGHRLFITGTIGSAAYPEDARDYDTLFSKVDKTLYRGKSKGRNCFIIYVEGKHGHLEIPKLAKRSLYETLREMAEAFDQGGDTEEKLRWAFAPIRENLRMNTLMVLDGEGALRDLISGQDLGVTGHVDYLMENGLYAPDNLSECYDANRVLAMALVKAGYESALFFRLEGSKPGPRCLILCPEPHTMHIWQDEERCAAFFLARLLNDAKK